MLAILQSLITGAWNALLFALRNPSLVLGGWSAMWVYLLFTTFTAQGVVGTVQFATTGLLNMGSLIGLPIPLAMMAIMLLKDITRLLTRGILRLVRLVQAEAAKAAKQAGKAIAKAVKSIKGIKKLRAASPDGYHLASAAAVEEERLLLEELAEALADVDLLALADPY